LPEIAELHPQILRETEFIIGTIPPVTLIEGTPGLYHTNLHAHDGGNFRCSIGTGSHADCGWCFTGNNGNCCIVASNIAATTTVCASQKPFKQLSRI